MRRTRFLSSSTLPGWKLNFVSLCVFLDGDLFLFPEGVPFFLAQGCITTRLFFCLTALFFAQTVPPSQRFRIHASLIKQQPFGGFHQRQFITRTQPALLNDFRRNSDFAFGINNQSFHFVTTSRPIRL